MQGIRLVEGDSYKVLQRMIDDGTRFASCVTDAPYGLVSIVDRFGKGEAKAAKFAKDGAFSRTSAAFMGQTWDANGVENDPVFWKLVFDVIKPGGYIVAFSSPRTYHKMATAIEAAGFITHPMIGWAYASGLPKPHNAKAPGREGFRHGGQVRKPAMEPIYVGQKPVKGPMSHTIRETGIGAVDIEGIMQDGRWPSNVITDGSDEVAALFPDHRVYEVYPFEGMPLIYNKKADKNDRQGSSHATVKPIKLMRSLVRHVTPPGETVLDPFAGSGTTGIAASLEGRSALLIEAEASYAMDIRSRLLEATDAGKSYMQALGIDE